MSAAAQEEDMAKLRLKHDELLLKVGNVIVKQKELYARLALFRSVLDRCEMAMESLFQCEHLHNFQSCSCPEMTRQALDAIKALRSPDV